MDDLIIMIELTYSLFSCVDIEKCEIHGGCSHFCSVDEDVYKCYCNAGYSLSQDNKTCQAQGKKREMVM